MADITKPPSGPPPARDPSEHRRAWDAIPWVVAGSAPIGDVNLVMHHLPHCASCREELEFQQRLHKGLADAVAPEADPEPGLQRLMARIDAANTEPMPQVRAPSPVRWLTAAVVVQAVGLAAAGCAMLGNSRDGEYRTLSTPQAPRAASLRVVPAAELDFAALRSLLTELKLDIVDAAPDGSSLGLAPADGQTATAQAALPRLRSHAGVRMAEPTGQR